MTVPLHRHEGKLQKYANMLHFLYNWGNTLVTYNMALQVAGVQSELSVPLEPDDATSYLALPALLRETWINMMLTTGLMESFVVSIAAEDIKAPPDRDPILALNDFMAVHEIADDGETTARLRNTVATLDQGADFTNLIAVNDYVYRKSDGPSHRQRVTVVVGVASCTLAAAYTGVTGEGDIIVEKLVQSRQFTKAVPAYSNSCANSGWLYQLNTDRYGFDIETPKKDGTWKWECVQYGEYAGTFNLTFNDPTDEKKGTESDELDPYGCRAGEEIEGIVAVNPYDGSGILGLNASTFPYSATVADLENYKWYSSTAWAAGVAMSETVFCNREPGSKDPSNWTGTGSSLEFTGDHNIDLLLNKSAFNYDRPYNVICRYIYEDATVVKTLRVDLGSLNTSTTGQVATTANISVINTGLNLVGAAGSKFLTDLRIGDKVRIGAHAVADATEIESIESDIAATFVAGGYLGLTAGPAAGVVHHTGWHELSIFDYPYNFMPAGDLELEIDCNDTGGTNDVNIDSIDIYLPDFYFQCGGWYMMFAGPTDFEVDDEVTVGIAFTAADSKIQRMFVEFVGQSFAHIATNPSIADPAG